MARRRMRPEDLTEDVDVMFDFVRKKVLDGVDFEVVLLLDAHGVRRVLRNLSGPGGRFAEHQGELYGHMTGHRAVACVHVGVWRAAFLRVAAVARGYGDALPVDGTALVLVSAGYWPAREVFHVRLAEVIEAAGVRDLREIQIPGLEPGGWLADLMRAAQ